MIRPGLLLAGALLSLAACARATPPLERYRLVPVLPGAAGKAAAGKSGSAVRPVSSRKPARKPLATLRIDAYVTRGIYADRRIDYRTEDSRYGAYPNRQWALPLGTMLADITAEVVRSAARGRVQVTGSADGSGAEYVWRGSVRRFEEVNRDERVHVAVQLDGALVRARDDSVLWQGTAQGERPVEADSMPAVVAAFSALGTETVTRMLRDAARAVLLR